MPKWTPALLARLDQPDNSPAVLQSAGAGNLVAHLATSRIDVLRGRRLNNGQRQQADNRYCNRERPHGFAGQLAAFRRGHYARPGHEFEHKMGYAPHRPIPRQTR